MRFLLLPLLLILWVLSVDPIIHELKEQIAALTLLAQSVEFGCEMCIRFLYLTIHTEYIDENSMHSEILAVHIAVHPGSASRQCSRYNLNLIQSSLSGKSMPFTWTSPAPAATVTNLTSRLDHIPHCIWYVSWTHSRRSCSLFAETMKTEINENSRVAFSTWGWAPHRIWMWWYQGDSWCYLPRYYIEPSRWLCDHIWW